MPKSTKLPSQNVFSWLVRAFYLLSLVVLGYSVLRSGLGYTYDGDEISHSHVVYLIAQGYKPFTSFYTIYSPMFHYLLVPVYRILGFSFATIGFARYIMVVLFALRVLVSFFIVVKLFGRKTALLFLGLFLLDPFSTFAGMQIRPDTLMMTVYAAGLLVFLYGFDRSRIRLLFVSGILLGGSLLINVKIFPSIVVFVSIFTLYALVKKTWKTWWAVSLGMLLTLTVFALSFMLAGSFSAMVRQMILDPRSFLASVDYPVHVGFFYLPGNAFIYGVGGKPASWIFAWVLPILAFAGVYHVLITRIKTRVLQPLEMVKVILGLSVVAQWLLLFTLETAFIQYYLPISWLFAVFAAWAIRDVLSHASGIRWLHGVLMLVFVVWYIWVVRTSVQANLKRGTMHSEETEKAHMRLWSRIPASSLVFPDLLFRPSAYPLSTGYLSGVKSQAIQSRYPPIPEVLEAKRVPYVIINDYLASYLTAETRAYIATQYRKLYPDDDIYIRK